MLCRSITDCAVYNHIQPQKQGCLTRLTTKDKGRCVETRTLGLALSIEYLRYLGIY